MPAGDMPAGGRGAAFQYPAGELITSSLSNKGNATAFGPDNTFRVLEQNEVRIVDNKGNLLFSGTGPEAARQAVEIGKNLSDTLGNKAGWTIQTGERTINPDGSVGATRFYDVANEKVNKSTLSKIGDVVGTALPIAVGFIPGFGQLATGLQIAAGAGAGAVGAGLRGDNVLKGAVMGGLSSAGGTLVGDALRSGTNLGANAARAIGTGIGTTAGGVVTGQSLENALLSGVASGGLSYLGGEAFGKRGTTPSGDVSGNIGSSGVELGDIVVNAGIPRFSGAIFTPSFADKAQLNSDRADPYGTGDFAVRTPATVDSGLTQDEILVNALRNAGSSTFSVGAPKTQVDFAVPEEIIVEAQKNTDSGTSTLAVSPTTTTDSGLTQDEIEVEGKRKTDTTTGPLAVGGPDIPVGTDDILVTGKKPTDTTTSSSVLTIPGGVTVPKDIIDLANKDTKATDDKKKFGVDDALLALAALGAAGGGGGGTGGKTVSTGKDAFQPVFSAKLPTPGEGGSIKVGGLGPRVAGPAGTFSARPATDWYRYGMGRAMDIPAGADLSKATSPYAGYGPGTLGEETFKAVTGAAHGGPIGYSRGSSRESFAVEGPGTGRSDDIPAVLSDGEYVIDAETVALLGDGSSKAGAKKLDEMRVKIRKHKGRNLAKGKFSVNAKRPEKYLSGGRA